MTDRYIITQLAALLSAIGLTKSKLSEQKIITFGAGSAGLGIARQIRDAMVLLDDISKEDASKCFYLIDKDGLLTQALDDQGKIRKGLDREFVRKEDEFQKGKLMLEDVVEKVKPTVLIGTSTHNGAFTEKAIRSMRKGCDRPIIFPVST